MSSWRKSFRSNHVDLYLGKSSRWVGFKFYRTILGHSVLVIFGKYSFQVVIRLGSERGT